MKTKNFALASFKAAEAEGEQGTFEAIVSVFGNVDRMGDRVMKGAFVDTLADWETRGRPIPLIFSHRWDDLAAHIGEVVKAEERDEGLYIKGKLDLEEDSARRVWKLMRKGTLSEFSFAYDVIDSNLVDQGEKAQPRYVNELRKLTLLETGPCLFGANPDTRLIDVKAGARHTGKEMAQIQAAHDLLISLGAKCAGDDSDGEGEDAGEDEASDGKSSAVASSTIAARVAAELIEFGIGD